MLFIEEILGKDLVIPMAIPTRYRNHHMLDLIDSKGCLKKLNRHFEKCVEVGDFSTFVRYQALILYFKRYGVMRAFCILQQKVLKPYVCGFTIMPLML